MPNESVKTWEVFGPNYSDDSRVGACSLGVFEGERSVVVDWVDSLHPGFKDHLEGRKHPKAEIREVLKPKAVTREMVAELRSAQEASVQAAARLKAATGN